MKRSLIKIDRFYYYNDFYERMVDCFAVPIYLTYSYNQITRLIYGLPS